VLMNIVSVYNIQSIRYLKRLGFTFNEHFTFDRAPDFPFVEFVKFCRKGETNV
jgi:RimJ/RimL family protein N-acetyltransferase